MSSCVSHLLLCFVSGFVPGVEAAPGIFWQSVLWKLLGCLHDAFTMSNLCCLLLVLQDDWRYYPKLSSNFSIRKKACWSCKASASICSSSCHSSSPPPVPRMVQMNPEGRKQILHSCWQKMRTLFPRFLPQFYWCLDFKPRNNWCLTLMHMGSRLGDSVVLKTVSHPLLFFFCMLLS
jgi:hypothetical protein